MNSDHPAFQAISTLKSLGLNTKGIEDQLAEKADAAIAQPSEFDLLYSLATPASWLPHFEHGVPTLSPSTIRVGARLTLTPGQRATLRERYEMTPTRVVEVVNFELYPGTKAIKWLTLRSDLHVPESHRKHILVHCLISDFGNWYRSSVELDQEAEKAREDKPRAKRASAGKGVEGRGSAESALELAAKYALL